MKRLNQILMASTLAAAFSSCQKIYDYTDLKKNHGKPGNCVITGIEYQDVGASGTTTDTLKFSYNKKGNLLSMERNAAYTGVSNYYFEYDKNGRLSHFYLGTKERTLPYATVFQWNVITYGKKSQIIADTVYVGPVMDGDQVVYSPMVYYSNFEYDKYGRIILEKTVFIYPSGQNPNTLTKEYTYDGNGNLVGGTYDNNRSYLSTNEILQFVDRNYSVNNGLDASSFNASGYPVDLETPIASFDLGNFSNERILYDCKK